MGFHSGLDSCKWTVVVDGRPVVLQLWDTAGQERWGSQTDTHTHTHTHFHTPALRPFCFSVSEGFTASHDRFFTEPRRSSWCTTSRPLRASLLSPTGPAVSRYHVSTAGPCRLQPWGHVHKPVKIFKRNLFAAIATRPLEGAPPNTLETPHLIKARFSTEWKCWLTETCCLLTLSHFCLVFSGGSVCKRHRFTSGE